MMCKARQRCERLIFAIFLTLVTAGCSHQRQRTLLETIPATASAIIHANADHALKMAGCHSRNGSITLSPDIELLLRHSEEARDLLSESARLGSVLDLANLYAFRCDSCWTLTAPIREKTSPLMQGRRCKVRGLGRAYATNRAGVSVLATEQQAWLGWCTSDTLATRLERILAAADKASVSQFAPISGFLPEEGPLARGYLAMPLVHNPLGQDYNALLVTVDGSDRAMWAKCTMLRNGFKIDAADSLQLIDTCVLDWMPGGTMASFAIGVGRGAVTRLMPWGRQFPLASQLAVNAISALADPDGGTIALGVAPGGSAETIKKLSVDNWLFKAMLPVADKGEDIADIINHVTNDRLYSESDSTYLAITNYDPEAYPSDYCVEPIPDAVMQARLSIGYRSEVMKAFRLSAGYLLEAWAADSALHARIKVHGPAQYMLPGLLHDLNAIIQ